MSSLHGGALGSTVGSLLSVHGGEEGACWQACICSTLARLNLPALWTPNFLLSVQ